MVMLMLPADSIKSLMNKLLIQETFDEYELRGCVIQSFARFDIESGCKWLRLRPYVYNIIKGNERPRFLKIIFGCPNDVLEKQFGEASALFMNIILDKDAGHITTGISTKVWSPDKSTEASWDNYIINFLQQNQIYFEQ